MLMFIRINWLRVCVERWRLVPAIIVALVVVISYSQAQAADMRIAAGITGLFDKQTATITQPKLNDINLNDDLGINKNVSLYEFHGGIYFRDFSIRGFYFQNRNNDGSGILNDGQFKKDKDTEKKPKPVNSTFGFRASRIEMGMPFVYTNTILEPFVVASATHSNLNIQGDKLNLDFSNIKSGPGMGVTIIQKAASNANVTLKAYKTNIDSLVEIEYTNYSPGMFWKAGYSWRRFDSGNINLNLSGPKIEIGVRF
jgi:opacity protein-like surface antigen